MTARFRDRRIVVTGAGSGMGRAEALGLAREGAEVLVADIDLDAARAVTEEITAAGGGTGRAHHLDVADPAAWESLSAALDGKALHGLVNNAGVSFRKGIAETSVADWHRVMDINLSSVFYGMKFLVGPLAQAGGAAVVNVSSIAGMVGYFSASYGASKWGVRGLSKVASLEFAAAGIRVNSVHPGLVDTPLLNSGDGRFVDESLRSVPAGRVASPEEVARTVAFLLSDEAAYINGTEIVVDGGLVSGGIYHRITTALAQDNPS
ncbi:SDR family NAD(P)-dependent oxidoreductase [Saccharopolyspora phatthalungensis]|uniref:3alpha(Or 20beta)-hydroxysteroid dehydrogenase n=1 Tax=Saccharopolyspora phatthalungensis TaxID=664693 RepID=A0A840QGY5_9PSEU|nr:SDR family NAD(P)-dependent oxidoreductase [Saccharopolyspora phatthalungensis]MBB5158028.1 3alpha(or 20beta)-hydroxysteroid dehydrogenase [Saccharopolyspora phatthalungensis]